MSRKRINLQQILAKATNRQRIIARLTDVVRAEWASLASARLGVSDKRVAEYKRGLSTSGSSVILTGTWPNMLEQGMGPGGIGSEGSYDARTFVLKPGTSNLRQTNDGRYYVNIPFSWSKSSIETSGGPTAWKAAKGLAALLSERVDGGAYKSGYNPNDARPRRLGAEFGDRLAGLVRLEKTYQPGKRGSTQSGYKTWRVMIEGGKPWMRRGIDARRIANVVLTRIPQILAKVW